MPQGFRERVSTAARSILTRKSPKNLPAKNLLAQSRELQGISKELEINRLEGIEYANTELDSFLKNIYEGNIPSEYNNLKEDGETMHQWIKIFYIDDKQYFNKLRYDIENNTPFIIQEIYLALDTMIKISVINNISLNKDGNNIKLMDILILNRYLFDNFDKSEITRLRDNEYIEDLEDINFNTKIKRLKHELFNKNYIEIQELVLFGENEP